MNIVLRAQPHLVLTAPYGKASTAAFPFSDAKEPWGKAESHPHSPPPTPTPAPNNLQPVGTELVNKCFRRPCECCARGRCGFESRQPKASASLRLLFPLPYCLPLASQDHLGNKLPVSRQVLISPVLSQDGDYDKQWYGQYPRMHISAMDLVISLRQISRNVRCWFSYFLKINL